MNFEVIPTPEFKREAKRLLKKYPSLKDDLQLLVESLEIQPIQGILLTSDCYKIKIAIGSKGRGKSGGARVITYVRVHNEKVFLLSIYDKSEQVSISDQQLKNQIEELD